LGPESTSSHQCTSCAFSPLDGLHFFHSTPNGVHHNPFFFWLLTTIFIFIFLLCNHFSLGPDFTPNYHVHFLTFIYIAPTLVPYLLSPIDITTLIISYPIDLAIVITTYPTNLATLLITYLTNLTTVLTTYPTYTTTLLT